MARAELADIMATGHAPVSLRNGGAGDTRVLGVTLWGLVTELTFAVAVGVSA